MRTNKFLIVCALIFVLVMSFAACGGSKDSETSAEPTTVVAAEPGTVENVIPTPDPAATVDALIATWQDVNSTDTSTVTKVGEEYQYEDKDGKYMGTFADGKLTVKVNDTETADIFVDSKSGHMFLIYQGQPTEFSKK